MNKKIKVVHAGQTFLSCDDNGEYHVLLEGGALNERVRLSARKSSPSSSVISRAILAHRIENAPVPRFRINGEYVVRGGLREPGKMVLAIVHGTHQVNVSFGPSRVGTTYQVHAAFADEGMLSPLVYPHWQNAIEGAIQIVINEHLPEMIGFEAVYDTPSVHERLQVHVDQMRADEQREVATRAHSLSYRGQGHDGVLQMVISEAGTDVPVRCRVDHARATITPVILADLDEVTFQRMRLLSIISMTVRQVCGELPELAGFELLAPESDERTAGVEVVPAQALRVGDFFLDGPNVMHVLSVPAGEHGVVECQRVGGGGRIVLSDLSDRVRRLSAEVVQMAKVMGGDTVDHIKALKLVESGYGPAGRLDQTQYALDFLGH